MLQLSKIRRATAVAAVTLAVASGATVIAAGAASAAPAFKPSTAAKTTQVGQAGGRSCEFSSANSCMDVHQVAAAAQQDMNAKASGAPDTVIEVGGE